MERTLVVSGATSVLGRGRMGRVAILAYHNVVPHGEHAIGDRSLHLDQRDFADQLDILAENHRVIALESLLDPSVQDGDERARAVITFDDAYQGALTAGLEELRGRGFPATVFVNPGRLRSDGFWWDLLAAPESGSLPPRVRKHAMLELKGQHRDVMAWARSEGMPISTLPDHARIARIESIRAAADRVGVTFGSHGWDHAHLPSLTDEEMEEEIGQGAAWCQRELPQTSSWLSYAYGAHSGTVARVASRFHAGGLRVEGGLAAVPVGPPDRFVVPRLNIPRGLSLDGFRLRLAGLGRM